MGNNRGRHRAADRKATRADKRVESTTSSSTKRKAQFVLATSGVTAAAVALGVAGPAFAVNPDQLRDGCSWASDSDQQRQIQTCTFKSEALGRDVNVQIRASNQEANGTEQGVYFLDGIGANNDRSTWANADVGEVEAFSKGVNLVLPAGGAGEWATNWQGDKVQNGVTTKGPQWETFLAEELPEYLNENFDVQKNNNAIVGVSMSGGPAIITALNNPTVFAVARSFSGFYQTDNVGGYQAIPYIQQTYTGISNGGTGMWGVPNTPGSTWAANDVSKRIAEAKASGQTIIISVGNGIPPLKTILALAASQGIAGIITLPITIATGAAIEVGSLVSTMLLNAQAVAQGLPVRFHYNFGSHDFYSWAQTAPQDAAEIEAALKAAQAKESTNAVARTVGPSTTLAATNDALAQRISTMTKSVTVSSKEALGSASDSTATGADAADLTTTGTETADSTSNGTTTESTTPAPPATESVPSTETSSTESAPTTGSTSTTKESTPPATPEKSTKESAPATSESTPSTTNESTPPTTESAAPTTTSESAPSTGTTDATVVTKTETTSAA